jgi:hypothetical protein
VTIAEIIRSFDRVSRKNFNEQDICSQIKKAVPLGSVENDYSLEYELIAFGFSENCQNKEAGWGTYYGPKFVYKNKDGTIEEFPSIKRISPEMIQYWEKRSQISVNPILKARYTGLVCDLKYRITGLRPSHEICRSYVESIIDQATGDFYSYNVQVFRKLVHALNLSISLNNETLINKCKDSIINFEVRHAQDNNPALWGYSFDHLLMGNKKIRLSDKEKKWIINELETRLIRLASQNAEDKMINPLPAISAARRLAIYYRKQKNKNEVARVILKAGWAFEQTINWDSGLNASSWLEQIQNLYLEFNLKEEADKIMKRIRDIGPKLASELNPISFTFNIPKEELDDYIPQRDKVKEQIFDISENAQSLFLIGYKLQDEEGRVGASIGTLGEDLEGHVVFQVSQNLQFASIFLRLIFQECIDKKGLNKEAVLDFIKGSPVIQKERLEIIDKGLEAYFLNDYLVSVHLLIPQIEESIRNLFELAGGNVLKITQSGDYRLKSFDEILREKIIKEVLGQDFSDYFRILFTDNRGWNIRNKVCHGIISPDKFNTKISDRLIHAILCLGLIQEKNNNYE